MITVREFLKMNRGYHYRIYQPNRDCLIFESYFKIHSPYYFNCKKKKELSLMINKNYWDNNDYCRDSIEFARSGKYDKETEDFLAEFGDYEVSSVEIGNFSPCRMTKDEKGALQIEYVKDPALPNRDYLDCFNLFIAPYDKRHTHPCNWCYHSLLKNTDGNCGGYIWVPDPKDPECKKCWRPRCKNYIGHGKLEVKVGQPIYYISTDGLTLIPTFCEDKIAHIFKVEDINDTYIMTKNYEAELPLDEYGISWDINKEALMKVYEERRKERIKSCK